MEEGDGTYKVQEVHRTTPPFYPTKGHFTPIFSKGDDSAILTNNSGLNDKLVARGLLNAIILQEDEVRYKKVTMSQLRGCQEQDIYK